MKNKTRIIGLGVACVLALGCETPTTTTPGNDSGTPGNDAGMGGHDAGTTGNDGGGTGDDGGGTGDDAHVAADGIEVTGLGSVAVPNGGRYEQVSLDGVPPYSDGVADLTIHNLTSAAIVVHSITLTPVGATEAYEWALNQTGTTSRSPITVSEESIDVDGGFSFGLFFYPLTSGPRDVEVDIAYGTGQHYTFTVAARGRDNATFSPVVSSAFERLFGRSNASGSNSFEPGGLVADAAGNLFFDGNVRQWNDGFNTNVVMVRVAADGSLSWVRELQEPFIQESRDIGNNGEIGGGEDSIAVDATGHAYLAAERGLSSSVTDGCLVLQVDGTSGALGWARQLNLSASMEGAPIAAQMLRCQAVDASLGDRVIVSGQVADSAGGFLAALSKTDGSLLWARTFGAGATRVGALVVDATGGSAYAAGTMSGGPFAARFDAVSGSAPTAAWIRPMGPGLSNIHGLALDGNGLLAAFDVRGATTFFTGARIATSDGSIVWSRTWDGAGSATNRSLSVALHGGQAIFSGRVGFQPFDTTRGDGFLLALDPATGGYEWGSFYYGGKGNEEIMNTLVTGLVSTSAGLWVLDYQTPGSGNQHHFWGRWYQANDDTLTLPGGDGAMRLEDAGLTASASLSTTLATPANFTSHAASVTPAEWADVTAMETYTEPVQAEADAFQAGTQALLQRLTITP